MTFLRTFLETIQEPSVAETFKVRANERNKSLTQGDLDYKNASIEEFRENLFLYRTFPLFVYQTSQGKLGYALIARV
jgi:hypothetical protein